MATYSNIFPEPTIFHHILLLLVILLFYYLIIPAFVKVSHVLSRQIQKVYPRIGVLDGSIATPVREYKCERVWTNVTPSMWLSELRKSLKDKRLKQLRMISTSEINSSFTIIINPFGDNFPEEDTKLHTTFYRICEYIKKGGIFVCTGGSFFLHQNPKISDKPEGVIIKIHEGLQFLKDSFLYLEFGVQTTGDEFLNGRRVSEEPLEVEIYQKEEDKTYAGGVLQENARIKRFRALTSKSSNYIPLIREKGNKSFPVVAVRYGDGYLIHAGMHLASVGGTEFQVLIQIISHLIVNKL